MRRWKWRLLAISVAGLVLLPLLTGLAWWHEQNSTQAMLDSYARIRRGDSRVDVEAALGKPRVVGPFTASTSVWEYEAGEGDVIEEWSSGETAIVVVFAGGQSVRGKHCKVGRETFSPLDYFKEQWRRLFTDP